MNTITIQAVYRGGVLKLTTHLDLPDGTTVEVRITPAAPPAKPTAFGLLSGIWSHLVEADFERLEHGLTEIRRQTAERIKRLARELKPNSP